MLEVKEKHLDRREWYSDSDRDFACRYHKDEFFEGGIGLITFTGIPAPDEVDSPEGRLCIADKGYQWVELVPKGGHYALTAMFRDGKLFQHYFDITLKNDVLENGDSLFYDLFLDVVIGADGKPRTIDTEELDEALECKAIGPDAYELAKKAADEVVALCDSNKALLEKKLYEYRELLLLERAACE